MKLSTWNVNGLRAAMPKGLESYLASCGADVVCLQEIKAEQGQCPPAWFDGWHGAWNSAVKKGYSGTLVLSRQPWKKVTNGMGIAEHDQEGRVITVEFPDFHLINVYTPNSQAALARLPYRMAWDDAFRAHIKKLEKTKPVLVCGDLNCAHKEIDLANPKTNRLNPGFSDEERASFDRHLEGGLVDVFRVFDPNPGRYTWWTQRTGDARAKNIGWRLDYWLATKGLHSALKTCTIRDDIHGSDHCPVEMTLG